jgi:hypothetical protein
VPAAGWRVARRARGRRGARARHRSQRGARLLPNYNSAAAASSRIPGVWRRIAGRAGCRDHPISLESWAILADQPSSVLRYPANSQRFLQRLERCRPVSQKASRPTRPIGQRADTRAAVSDLPTDGARRSQGRAERGWPESPAKASPSGARSTVHRRPAVHHVQCSGRPTGPPRNSQRRSGGCVCPVVGLTPHHTLKEIDVKPAASVYLSFLVMDRAPRGCVLLGSRSQLSRCRGCRVGLSAGR